MQITIRQREIEQALRNFVTSQVTVDPSKRIEIDLSAKRGAEGWQAVITIVDANGNSEEGSSETAPSGNVETASSSTQEVAPATTGAKKGSLFGGVAKPSNEPEVAQAQGEEVAA